MRANKSTKVTSEALMKVIFENAAAKANERKNSVFLKSRDLSSSSSEQDEKIKEQFPRMSLPGISQPKKDEAISKLFS